MWHMMCVCVCARTESRLALCDSMDYNPSGSSMRFPGRELWRGLSFPSPEDLSDPRIEHTSPALQADSLLLNLGRSPPEVWQALAIMVIGLPWWLRWWSVCIGGNTLLTVFLIGVYLVMLVRPLCPRCTLKKKKRTIARHSDLVCFAEIFLYQAIMCLV